jgi:hypothetical protein
VVIERNVHGGDDTVLSGEATVDREQPAETANQKARADEEHHRERNLSRNERGANAVLSAARALRAIALAKSRSDIPR